MSPSYEKSFASYKGRTKNGNLKVECWSKENKLKPGEVYKKSAKRIVFNCDSCFHKFDPKLYTVTDGQWCPYCSKQKLCQENCNFCYNNSFASYENKLKIKCWSDKNKLKPREVFKNSAKRIIFKCNICSHKFDSLIHSITNANSWCPYCSKQKLCQENCNFCYNNSFASYKEKTNKGKLKIDCWFETNKLKPREVFKYSHKYFIFECDVCFNSFKTMISNVTNSKCWCPFCKNKTEGKFKYYFENYYKYKLKYQVKYEWCKDKKYLPFDFSIEELKIIIEIDGDQHFRQVSNWKSPEDIFIRDNYKTNKALENGYTVIRILQEDIFNNSNNWQEELDKKLKKYEKATLFCIGCKNKYKAHLKINF